MVVSFVACYVARNCYSLPLDLLLSTNVDTDCSGMLEYPERPITCLHQPLPRQMGFFLVAKAKSSRPIRTVHPATPVARAVEPSYLEQRLLTRIPVSILLPPKLINGNLSS